MNRCIALFPLFSFCIILPITKNFHHNNIENLNNNYITKWVKIFIYKLLQKENFQIYFI